MRIRASATPLKRIVFMIDEAWKLAAKEFDWLMDLYNTLQNKYDVQMSVFLFGTKELLALRECLISDKQNQIVERFMLNSHRFYGIRSEMELGMCLMELDRQKFLTYRKIRMGKKYQSFIFQKLIMMGWQCSIH